MSESELGGFIQVAPYPLEAVPYQLFAKMIGRKESEPPRVSWRVFYL
ncbi:hypothetical protein EC95NR1_01430 [Escherichia coli]|nr:hypothetical protein EC95JB1_01432 [Escherichia coli]ART25265.1 hypothetical protein EC95NR1_01430 [Escherichia coli]